MWRRLAAWARARRAVNGLAEEIETHRLMIEHRLREEGMPSGAAAAASRRIMGNATLAREDARAVWVASWIESIWQDAWYALRLLRRAPAFSAAVIVVMSVGIGAATAIFGLFDGLVLRSLPVQQPDRLVYFARPSFSYPIFRQVREHGAAVFSSVAAWDMDRLNVAWSTELEPTEVLMASGDFCSTLRLDAALGRTFGPDDDRPGGGANGLVAMISHAAWQRRFNADPSVIGRAIRIEADTVTIIGVAPGGFFGVAPGLAPEIIMPLTSTASPERLRSASASWVHLLARLRDGVDLRQANAALGTFWPAVLRATTDSGMPPERRAIYLGRSTSLESARAGYSRVRNQFRDPLSILLGLVGLLLAIACASAANLLLARGVARQREVAVRLAIGAGRPRLIRQMLTEATVWTLLAAAAGLLLAHWIGTALVTLLSTSQETIVLDLGIDARLLIVSVGLALLTSAVTAAIPALRGTAADPGRWLKSTGQIESVVPGRWSAGRLLVSTQMALTVLLLFGAALFVRSLSTVLAQDAGIDRRRVLVLTTDPAAAGYGGTDLVLFYQRLQERLRSLPGVQSASVSLYPPISDEDGAWTQSIAVDGAPVPAQPGVETVHFNAVSAGYFQTVGMRLLRGRDFRETDDEPAVRVAIVNESLARKFFPGLDPLGRTITIGRSASRRDLQIVGIVSDAKYQRLQEGPRSIAYLPWRQERTENLFAEIRAAAPAWSVAESVRKEVRGIDPVVPMRLETVDDRIRESLVTERVLALLASALAGAAVVLACAALYGLLAYSVSRRSREIGVRLALGAPRSRVLGAVVADSLRLAAIGAVVGTVASLWLGRTAAALLHQLSPRDPLSLIAATGIMLLVACLASVVPARRAARVDPVVALKCE